MCGIAGKLYFDRQRSVDPHRLQQMTNVIAHRGPDGEGVHVAGPIGLGHRRLSIIDLGTGAQPMCNEDETVWITFNGEIYNYRELRQGLLKRGHTLRTQSDTEVIVHLWEDYGAECVKHLRGMFAFGIWDARQRTLFLARDRVGIKPLYYCRTNEAILFASEIKALLVDPDVPRDISLEAVDRFLTFLYLPGEGTMFEHVRKLSPGHYLLARRGQVEIKEYWDLDFTPRDDSRDINAAAEELGHLLRETVKCHMISDVPVGFLASGGVDSTALLSYAVEETSTPIQTFTVGFAGSDVVDERPFARLASRQFNTVHHEITVSADDFRSFLPSYIWHMEEPVCEPPAIALYYVAKLAREHVKVLLSGEGGDEAFGGYPEYRNYSTFERLKSLLGPLKGAFRSALTLAGRLDSFARLRKYASLVDRSLPDYFYSRVSTPHSYFIQRKSSLYSEAFRCSLNGHQSADITRRLFSQVSGAALLNQMLYVDSKTWLPDDLLIKADKMTMATSLELRVPFLDHTVLEFAARLPPVFKVRGGESKRVLKRTFDGRVPDEILRRKKAGFPVPYGHWLSTELREFVRDSVLSVRAVSRGYFDRETLTTALNGQPSDMTASEVFSLLVLEMWHERFVDGGQAVKPTSPLYANASGPR